jgi:hypothetical protein
MASGGGKPRQYALRKRSSRSRCFSVREDQCSSVCPDGDFEWPDDLCLCFLLR